MLGLHRRPYPCQFGALCSAGMLAGILAASPAAAADGWSFTLMPYVWAAGVATSVATDRGTVDVETSTSDALSNLDMAFMGVLEARNGRWGLVVDTLYVDLGASAASPLGALWSEANMDTKMSAISGYAAWRAVETERASLDLLAGVRFFSLDVGLTLEPGRAQGQSYDLGDDWSDPLLGLRGRYAITDDWYVTAAADVGGFSGSSDESWQAIATIGYQIGAGWSAQAGWRAMAVRKEVEGYAIEVDLNGPVVGVAYRF